MLHSVSHLLPLCILMLSIGALQLSRAHRLGDETDTNAPESFQLAGEEDLLTKSGASGARKCAPTLDLPALLNNTSTNSSLDTAKSYSFKIDDIDMPIVPPNGTVNSALRLLATFSDQLSGGLGALEGTDDDDNSDPSRSAEYERDEELPDNMVAFRENRLTINGPNMTMLNVHLFETDEPRFSIGVTIRNTTLSGRFAYRGPLVLANSKIGGYYRMSIDNIYLVASSNLTRAPATHGAHNAPTNSSSSSSSSSSSNLVTNDFRMNITNLGYISIDIFDSRDSQRLTSSYLLRVLQRVLQRTIKRTYYTFENHIRETLERESRLSVDCELSRFSSLINTQPVAFPANGSTTAQPMNTKSNKTAAVNYQADLARIVNSEISRSHLNKVSLPDFEHHQTLLGSGALIKFKNGSLLGLDHLNLAGDTRVKLQEGHLFVNTSLGWTDLKMIYDWELRIGSPATAASKPPTTTGFVSGNIKEIVFDAVITKGLRPNTRLKVGRLEISRFESPKMDISGLPGMNRITRATLNFFMSRLKQRVSTSIQSVLKTQLERTLNNF